MTNGTYYAMPEDATQEHQQAITNLVETVEFLLHLEAVAKQAQLDWEKEPTPGELTYTSVIVRAVVTEMVKANKTGKIGTHYLVDEYDLKALLSAAHSLGVSEWPVNFDLDVMQRVEKIVGHP